MKKIFTLLLALVATTALWAEDFSVGGIYYKILNGSEVEVTYRGSNDYDYDEYSGSVTIPSTVTYNGTTYSVTSIGDRAFSGCTSLTSVTIGNNVTSIGIYAFVGTSLTTPVYNAHCFAYLPTSFKGAYVIPEGIKQIAGGAFYYCFSLTSITIPNSVTSIGDYAFSDCFSLTTPVYNAHCFAYLPTSFKGAYVIPEGIKQIAGGAFSDCSSLTSITIPNSVTSIGNSAFERCSSLTSIVIPNNVTSIGDYAFYLCSSLTSVTIGNSVTSIGDAAFYYCTSLTSITIPNSVTSIARGAFYDCSSLTSITIPNSVTSIGNKAFFRCSSLTSIVIPNNVTSIGDYAFYNCSSLTSIICLGTTPPDASDLGAPTSTCTLTVPQSAYNAYLRHAYWGQFLNIVAGDWFGENRDMTIIFTNSEDNDSEIYSQSLTLTIPAAPEIEGFTFLYWQPVAEPLTDTITIQAIYEANAPASAPEVYINPANPAQKLIRNGQVYILKDDKTYTIMGARVE